MPKLWQQAIGATLAILFAALVPASSAYADTKPYFRTQNGGPFVGGWFNNGNTSCDDSSLVGNYQAPSSYPPAPGADGQHKGAIMAWANADRTQSANSNLDAFATGLIEGNNSSEYGFYTGLSGTGPLSFANVYSLGNPPFWGGIFEGAALNAHCIPDYFGTKQDGPAGWSGNYGGDGQFRWNGSLTLNGGQVSQQLILFVEGDVTINDRITYEPGYNITNVPKFALVVKGNIYIAPNVDRLDGWYIAQPDPTNINGTGVIWTCNTGTPTVSDTFIRTNCDNSELDLISALSAKQINLGRITGGLGSSSAETVNFSPEMVLGGPFFEDEDTIDTTGAIQSLISLPPVF